MKRDDLRAGITWEPEKKLMDDDEMFDAMMLFTKQREGFSH